MSALNSLEEELGDGSAPTSWQVCAAAAGAGAAFANLVTHPPCDFFKTSCRLAGEAGGPGGCGSEGGEAYARRVSGRRGGGPGAGTRARGGGKGAPIYSPHSRPRLQKICLGKPGCHPCPHPPPYVRYSLGVEKMRKFSRRKNCENFRNFSHFFRRAFGPRQTWAPRWGRSGRYVVDST